MYTLSQYQAHLYLDIQFPNICKIYIAVSDTIKDQLEDIAEAGYSYGYKGQSYGKAVETIKEVKQAIQALRAKGFKGRQLREASFYLMDIFIKARNEGSKQARAEGLR